MEKKNWYKNGWIIGLLVLIAFTIGYNSSLVSQESDYAVPATSSVTPQYERTAPNIPDVQSSNSLSNDNFYTNVSGNSVHSPAFSNSVPSGASARCGDGTYSFSQHRQGTCSHHGGVSDWLY